MLFSVGSLLIMILILKPTHIGKELMTQVMVTGAMKQKQLGIPLM